MLTSNDDPLCRNDDVFEALYKSLEADVAFADEMRAVESGTHLPALAHEEESIVSRTARRTATVLNACRRVRRRHDEVAPESSDASHSDDAYLITLTRFTDKLALKPYEPLLHLVPRQVNVVTLAEAVPVPGLGATLPLDLRRIARRCNGVYFAPRRFAAVQLAYTNPRCRILIFHTGRIVGTGVRPPLPPLLPPLAARLPLPGHLQHKREVSGSSTSRPPRAPRTPHFVPLFPTSRTPPTRTRVETTLATPLPRDPTHKLCFTFFPTSRTPPIQVRVEITFTTLLLHYPTTPLLTNSSPGLPDTSRCVQAVKARSRRASRLCARSGRSPRRRGCTCICAIFR